MDYRLLVPLILLATTPACIHRGAIRTPIACPVLPPPAANVTGSAATPHRVNMEPRSIIGPGQRHVTLIIDDRIVVIDSIGADSAAFARAVGVDLDPRTIREIEVVPLSAAAVSYPSAIGPVIRITRCY